MIISMATVQSKPEIKVELKTGDVGTLWRDGKIKYQIELPGKGIQFSIAICVQKDAERAVEVFFGQNPPQDNVITMFLSLDAIVEVLNAGSQRHAIAQSDLTVMLCIKGA